MACYKDKYFWRQSIILFADCLHSIGSGIQMAFPSVLNPAILSPNSTDIRATSDQASWIASAQGFSGPIGFFLIPPVMQALGRKIAHISLTVIVGISFLILALAQSVPALYTARIIQGLSVCAITVTTIIVGEYSEPKRRGYFVALKKGSAAFGSLICHASALYWTWREIAFFAIVPSVLASLFTLFWPESPAFLALKGRYEECDRAFTWLYGSSLKATKELEELIAAQKQQREENKNRNDKISKFIRNFMKRDFILSFLIVSLLIMLIDVSGRHYMPAYIVQMLTEIMGDKTIAIYCTIGADLLTLLALVLSCFVIRHFKRRTILFMSGTVSVGLMFLISLVAYLKLQFKFVTQVYWLIPFLILLNIFIVNAGIVPTCFAIISEIFPLEHKGMGSFTTGIVFSILIGILLKITPVLMETTELHGTFVIYAVWMIIVFFVLHFLLNETKDKTLQEIENEMKNVKKTETSFVNEELLPSN